MKFELFGRLKGKKSKEVKPIREIPFEKINKMAENGLSEAQIIDALQQEGYTFAEIDKALSSAVRNNVEKVNEVPQQTSIAGDSAPQMQNEQQLPPVFDQNVETPEESIPSFDQISEQPAGYERSSDEIEEIVEAVIEEKLEDINSRIIALDDKLVKINEIIQKLSDTLQETVKQVKGQVDDINRKVEDVEGEVQNVTPQITSLEKAFKSNVPNLIDEVGEIREMFKKAKKKKK